MNNTKNVYMFFNKKRYKNKLFLTIIISILVLSCFSLFCNLENVNEKTIKVYADSLTDEIDKQYKDLDLSGLENFFNSLNVENSNFSIKEYISNVFLGDYGVDYNSVYSKIVNSIKNNVTDTFPIIFSVLIIAIFCSITKSVKSRYLSESVSETITFVGSLGVVLILLSQVGFIYKTSIETVGKINNLNQAISPILLTLMVSSGANISVSLYKPIVALYSGGVISIVNSVVLPISMVLTVFSVISSFSTAVKLNKFIEFGSSIIKWIIGLTLALFTLFVSVQGFSGAVHDGISVRATKYALSNSIPLVGGIFRDGFDLICCGSILIKNAVGLCGIVILLIIVISPVIKIVIFSLTLKLLASLTETFNETKISSLCTTISKSLSYFVASILLSAFMFFIIILLTILTASVFI